MSTTSPQHVAAAQQVPAAQYVPATPQPTPPRRGELAALFRADLQNYTRRWSTWLPLALALCFGLVIMVETLTGGTTNYTSDGGGRRITGDDISVAMSALSVVVPGGMGYLAGAAWMGAEHTSGSLGAWLTFNPRRVRVWLSRLTVAVLVPTVMAVIGLLLAALPVLGDPDGFDVWSSAFGRYLIVVIGFSALGFSIASLGRHVLWALGAFAGYAALIFLHEMVNVMGGNNDLYLLHDALNDLLEDPSSSRYHHDVITGVPDQVLGAVVWVGTVLLVAAVALVVFRRRDVD